MSALPIYLSIVAGVIVLTLSICLIGEKMEKYVHGGDH